MLAVRARLGPLARFDQCLGDVANFDIEVLGGPTQDVECLIGGDAFALHQDALGLANHLPGNKPSVKIVGFTLFNIVGLSCG